MKNKSLGLNLFIAFIVAIASYCTGVMCGLDYDPSTTYNVSAIVEEIDLSTNWATIIDWNGETWCVRDETLSKGEMVIVVFNDNQTENIYDDMIVNIIHGNTVLSEGA